MLCPVFLPHLGCDRRCIYCDQTVITGTKTWDIEKVIRASLPKTSHKYEVGLFGGNIFGISPSLLKKIFSIFDSYRENISGFRISTKPVPIKEEIIGILKENNVKIIELGIPVFNDSMLFKLNRGYTVADFYNAYSLLKKEGFDVAIQVMVGLPDETREEVGNTLRHIKGLKPSYIRIYPLVILKDTPLYYAFEKGEFITCDFNEVVLRALYIYLNALSKNIPVVKMGLTDNEIIKDKIAGGFYHPAFGDMVKSEGFYLALTGLFSKYAIKGKVRVKINKRDESHIIGFKRKNMERWKDMGIYVEREIKELTKGAFIVSFQEKDLNGDILDAIPNLSEAGFEKKDVNFA
ncbi:MAG TPA: radical SAM protein [Syntrophorhabdaceae bacterium]|nr:radical SAM protein [Syntrophorhabdaceae bacterium]